MIKIKLLSILLLGCSLGAIAQTGIVASGVKATGSGGTVSYSVGPIVFKKPDGQPATDGLQQPFEILTLSSVEINPTSIDLSFYPNPTVTDLHLVLKNKGSDVYYFKLSSPDGKTLVTSQKIINEDTIVDMLSYPKGIYLLQIITGNKNVKTFKIIKR
jgi:hypothetical protein